MDLLARIFDWLREQEAGFSAVAAILVIAGVVFAGFRWLVSRRSQPTPEAPTESARETRPEPTTEKTPEEDPLLALPTGPTVAVLPFTNMSRDPDQEYFSDGLTEGIITALSRFKDLFVIARNSTFRYKGQAVDVRQLNRELGARYVLEGSVQRAESTLRVTAQLLDAKDGTHLWAETYDRELSAASIFAVHDEITEQVVAAIAGGYGVLTRARFAEVKGKPTESLDAYESVMQAMAYYRGIPSASEHAKTRDALERAVKSDPEYADACAFLSMIYLDEHRVNLNPRPDPLDRALETARRAVTLDATSQASHSALAQTYFHRHELDSFLPEAERGIALNPNGTGALAGLALMLHQAGDERGITLVRKLMKLDPFHPPVLHLVVADYHFQRGEYEEALASARKGDMPGVFFNQIYLAAIYAALDRQSDAASAVEELVRLYPGFSVERYVQEARKWNRSDETIQRYVAALRKAGLPE